MSCITAVLGAVGGALWCTFELTMALGSKKKKKDWNQRCCRMKERKAGTCLFYFTLGLWSFIMVLQLKSPGKIQTYALAWSISGINFSWVV